MDRPGHKNITFFVGTEVEHTPAYGKKTLFVVGVQPVKEVLKYAREEKVDHIYFGANQSFPMYDMDVNEWQPWDLMIWDCMSHGYLCTLDIDVYHAEQLLNGRLVEEHNFIPMLSVKLPYIQQYGYNATIKIDDKDFRATNPGVWCHRLHDLRNSESFTDWSKYTQDEVLK